jgi:hypothetical protein
VVSLPAAIDVRSRTLMERIGMRRESSGDADVPAA